MPKENKSASRRNRCQCSEVDNNIAAKGTRDSLKSATGSTRYSPFPREVPRRDSRTENVDMAIPSTQIVHSSSGSIIGNGIKYIMFPLHLLRFCIFGTSTRSIESQKKTITEPKESIARSEKSKSKTEEKTKNREERSTKTSDEATSDRSSKETRKKALTTSDSKDETKNATTNKESSKAQNISDNDDSTDEMVTAAEDSDTSVEYWSTASSTMMNMSVDLDSIDRSMSYTILEEPMDISIDESALEKSDSTTKILRESRTAEKHRINRANGESSRLDVDKRDSNLSVDEEIARIFKKQCTSSDDEFVFSNTTSHSSSKRDKSKQNFLCKVRDNGTTSTSRKEVHDGERDSKKTTSSEYTVSKRRKTTDNVDENVKQKDRRAESRTREERRSSRQDTPSKYKSRSSKTPVKNKESKRKDVKYKEMGTQTDSAFSDDDVEMTPIETELSERQFCRKSAVRKALSGAYQEMEHDLNYIADNEDSNDGYINIARKRISSCSTSSSSTDLGFEERTFATPEKDVSMELWHSNSVDTLNTLPACSRAPPGFPQVPQNPPLTSCTYCSKHFFLSSIIRDRCLKPSAVQISTCVPPAPTPMRHLYYNYPEFMDLPANANSSKFLKNILENYYYR